MKIVVYTAIFGNIDKLWSVYPLAAGKADWVAFSDQPLREVGLWTDDNPPQVRQSTGLMGALPTWEIRRVPQLAGPRKTARHYKALPHRYLTPADVWIWVDGNVRPMLTPEEMVREYLGSDDLAIFRHPERDCLYEEATFCAEKGKDDPKVLRQQARLYEAEGMPHHWGLPETRCVIRRNTDKIKTLGDLWWHELLEHSVRDQVSLPYCCWKLGLRWREIPGRCFAGNTHKHFHYVKHHM